MEYVLGDRGNNKELNYKEKNETRIEETNLTGGNISDQTKLQF
jgi:hypothetical protein